MSDEDKVQRAEELKSEATAPTPVHDQEKDAHADLAVEREMRSKTRRSFLVGAGAALAAYGGWHWLGTRREDGGIPWPLRRAHEINEQLSRDYFKSSRLAPTFPLSTAQEPRVNGLEGMDEGFEPQSWTLAVAGLANPPESSDNDGQVLTLMLDDIKKLPRVEMVTEHKCIEGWSVIVHWAGARFADFAAKYPPGTRSGDAPDVLNKPADLVPYVGIETPGGGYYVGLEMESALHPQTLLCYEMNGQPLTLEHGAPLRLVTPLKYGIKSIKRIGKISFTDKRPADYWAEQGYDWYSGH